MINPQDRKTITDLLSEQYLRWDSRFLDTIGDKTGSINANVDGSIIPVDFRCVVPPDKVYFVNGLVVGIVTDSKINSGEYGNIIALTNGVTAWFKEKEGDILSDRTTQMPVKITTDWQMYSNDLKVSNFGIGNESLTVRHNFIASGAPLIMLPGGEYTIRIADDLTELIGHYFRLELTSRDV